jgi:hypothetical protein
MHAVHPQILEITLIMYLYPADKPPESPKTNAPVNNSRPLNFTLRHLQAAGSPFMNPKAITISFWDEVEATLDATKALRECGSANSFCALWCLHQVFAPTVDKQQFRLHMSEILNNVLRDWDSLNAVANSLMQFQGMGLVEFLADLLVETESLVSLSGPRQNCVTTALSVHQQRPTADTLSALLILIQRYWPIVRAKLKNDGPLDILHWTIITSVYPILKVMIHTYGQPVITLESTNLSAVERKRLNRVAFHGIDQKLIVVDGVRTVVVELANCLGVIFVLFQPTVFIIVFLYFFIYYGYVFVYANCAMTRSL